MNLLQRVRATKQALKERGKHTLAGQIGMTFVEIVILISIILVIAVALFTLRGKMVDLLNTGNDYVDGIKIPNSNANIENPDNNGGNGGSTDTGNWG